MCTPLFPCCGLHRAAVNLLRSMFEQKRCGWNFNWVGIVLVVVFVLAVVWVFRQNPPSTPADAPERKAMWTSGKIVEGPLQVEAKSYLSFPVNLNKRSTLIATFTTGENLKKLTFSVFAARELESWKVREEVNFLTHTGPVPRGTVKRVLEPGYYMIVLDNRASAETIRITESNIEVE